MSRAEVVAPGGDVGERRSGIATVLKTGRGPYDETNLRNEPTLRLGLRALRAQTPPIRGKSAVPLCACGRPGLPPTALTVEARERAKTQLQRLSGA